MSKNDYKNVSKFLVEVPAMPLNIWIDLHLWP